METTCTGMVYLGFGVLFLGAGALMLAYLDGAFISKD